MHHGSVLNDRDFATALCPSSTPNTNLTVTISLIGLELRALYPEHIAFIPA